MILQISAELWVSVGLYALLIQKKSATKFILNPGQFSAASFLLSSSRFYAEGSFQHRLRARDISPGCPSIEWDRKKDNDL